MKKLLYGLKYIKASSSKSLTLFFVFLGLASTLLVTIGIKESQEIIYKNMVVSQGLKFEANISYTNNLNSFRNENAKKLEINLLQKLSGEKLLSYDYNFKIKSMVNDEYSPDKKYYAVQLFGLNEKHQEVIANKMVEGSLLSDSDVDKIVISKDFYLYDQNGKKYYPQIGDEICFLLAPRLLYINSESMELEKIQADGYTYAKLDEVRYIVKGKIDDNSNVIYASNNLIEKYYTKFTELNRDILNSYFISEFNGHVNAYESFFIDASIEISNISFELNNIEEARSFRKIFYNELKQFENKFTEGNLLKIKTKSTINIFDDIIEPFNVLRENLNICVFIVVLFLSIMVLVMNINILNSRQKEFMIRKALGEKKTGFLFQTISENIFLALTSFGLAVFGSNFVIMFFSNFMFKRSIDTQNNLIRIATGEIDSLDVIYENSKYLNTIQIDFKQLFFIFCYLMLLIVFANVLGLLFNKTKNIKKFLN